MYAEIKEGQVAKYISNLRGAYKFSDGTTTGNVELLSDAELAIKGIIPVQETKPVINDGYQDLVESGVTIDGGVVKRTFKVTDKGIEFLRTRLLTLLKDKLDDLVTKVFLDESLVTVPKSPEAVNAYSAAVMDRIYSIHVQFKAHKTAIQTLATAKAVAEYQITFN